MKYFEFLIELRKFRIDGIRGRTLMPNGRFQFRYNLYAYVQPFHSRKPIERDLFALSSTIYYYVI